MIARFGSVPTKSRSQIGLVLVIVAIAVFQMFSVTFAAIPANKVSSSLSSTTAYLNPFFTQNWRLFAPNPISEDQTLWFQGEYVDAAGRTTSTEWFDWTAIELDLVRHQLVGGRAGYITSKLIGPLNTRYFALNPGQRELADGDRDAAVAGYANLRKRLIAAGGNPAQVNLYLRYETGTVELATSALRALHPDTTFTVVRYRIDRRPVVPFAERALPTPEREKYRPATIVRKSGWRNPIQGTASERQTIAGFLRRHR